jgi:hypothetical protein
MRTLVDCGCETKVHADGSGVEVYFCPLHEAAGEMHAVLLRIQREISNTPSPARTGFQLTIESWMAAALKSAAGR